MDEGTATSEEEKEIWDTSKRYVELIEMLFAVVLALSFVVITTSKSQSGVLESVITPLQNPLPPLTLFSSYVLVASSYVGFKKSVEQFPHRGRLGTLRFGIDVALLLLYYSAFLATPDFGLVLILYDVIFGLYALWSFIRVAEYRDLEQSRPLLVRRAIRSSVFFLGFIAITGIYAFAQTPSKEFLAGVTWIFVLYYFILYRTRKPPKRLEPFILKPKGPGSSSEKP